MENGGNGEHRPWIFGNDTLEIYREFAHIHTDLAPFLLSSATKSYAKNVSSIKPIAERSPIPIVPPSTFDFILAETFYVSPFLDNSTRKSLKFPGVKDHDEWIYWFNHSQIYKAGQEVDQFFCPYREFPVFTLAGSIVALNVKSSYSNLGHARSKEFITLMITRPIENKRVREEFHEFLTNGYIVEYEHVRHGLKNGTIHVSVSAHEKNKFIILLSGLDLMASSTSAASSPRLTSSIFRSISQTEGYFEELETFGDTDMFWSRPNMNGAYFARNGDNFGSKQYFVRIAETARQELKLKIQYEHF